MVKEQYEKRIKSILAEYGVSSISEISRTQFMRSKMVGRALMKYVDANYSFKPIPRPLNYNK